MTESQRWAVRYVREVASIHVPDGGNEPQEWEAARDAFVAFFTEFASDFDQAAFLAAIKERST